MAADEKFQTSYTEDSDENFLINKEMGKASDELNPCDPKVSWDTICELGIPAKTGDGMSCGNVICTYKDNIIVIHFGKFKLLNEYMIPISRIKRYDGRFIYLSVPDETTLQPYMY
jgi:hypothetical protein